MYISKSTALICYSNPSFKVFLSIFLMALIVGCSALTQKPASYLSVSKIVQLSKEKKPNSIIINMIKDSGTVYRLSASQLADLKQKGVSDSVINYLQHTYLEAIRLNQQLNDERYWVQYNDGYFYGGYPFGWDSGWYPDEPYNSYPQYDNHILQPDGYYLNYPAK